MESLRRAKGVEPLTALGACLKCCAAFAKTSGARKYCPACGDARKAESERLAKLRWAERNKDYVPKKDPEKRKAAQDRYAEKNRERIRLKTNAARAANREEFNAQRRAHNKTSARRAYVVEWERKKRASDPVFVLNTRMRQAVRRHLNGGKCSRRWRDMVGYGPDELKVHLERQFAGGMGWHNMGEWHVDHILPLSGFGYSSADDPEFRAAWALTNLRPLWGEENVRKGGKRLTLL